MIPWTKKKDLNVFHGEYAQQSVPNRVFNRLLDNDRTIEFDMDAIALSAEAIEYASKAEVEAQVLSAKVIRPATVMALSATPAELELYTDTRFVTTSGHIGKIENLSTGVSYIDITHAGVYGQWPAASAIESEAKDVLGAYTPLADVYIDVTFYYLVYRGVGIWDGKFYYTDVPSYYGASVPITRVARYRYQTVTGSTDWTYIGRLVNANSRLNQ